MFIGKLDKVALFTHFSGIEKVSVNIFQNFNSKTSVPFFKRRNLILCRQRTAFKAKLYVNEEGVQGKQSMVQ